MSGAAINRQSSFTMPMVTLAVLCVAVWQWATVTANYGGNWTALYCTGALQPHPPLDATEHVYVFPNSTGYDGQIYHYVAHDPLMRTGLKAYVDDPRLRYRRILVPALAYALALGRSEWIDPAYEIVFLFSVGIGVYWSCRFCQSSGLAPAWGLLFLLIPAIPVTMDRLIVDGTLAALTAAFVYYRNGPPWKLFCILACAALTRETGFLLIAAVCLFHLFRREFRLTAIFAASAAPALIWYSYVQFRTQPSGYHFSLIPFADIAQALSQPLRYAAGTPLATLIVASDYAALTGALLAVGLAFYSLWRPPTAMLPIAATLFALLELVQRADHWQNVYDFGRLQSPMLICLAAIAVIERKPWLLTPVPMMLPRLAIQFAPQMLGVLHYL